MKRYICAILTIILAVSLCLSFATFAEDYNTYMNINFEGTTAGTNGNVEGTGFSFSNSNCNVVTGVISGKSVKIQTADFRMWTMSVTTKDKFYFEFDVKFDENFNNELLYCTTWLGYESKTASEGVDGWMVKVSKNSNGEVCLYNKGGKAVTVLESGKVNKVKLVATRGTRTYDIYVNGQLVNAENKYSAYFYKMLCFRLNVSQKTSNSYVYVDNIKVYTTLSIPQQYSSQEKGKVPTITIPDTTQKGINVYYNNKQVSLSNEPFERNNTVYIAAEDIVKPVSGQYSYKDNTLTFNINGKKSSIDKNTKKLVVNGVTNIISNEIIQENNKEYVPLDLVNILLNVKVWYDKDDKCVALTDYEHAHDDILRSVNEKLYMNGEPYYEISFNKFDLAFQISADYFGYSSSYPSSEYTYKAAEEALSQLHDAGFKSIRVFCSCGSADVLQTEESKAKYYEIFDKMYDLCDKYDIKVVACLNLPSDTFLKQVNVGTAKKPIFVPTGDSVLDLVSDPNCESRESLYEYIREYVGRYKNRKTILMWEIVNEGNLGADIGSAVQVPGYSLLQLGQFYSDCAKVIRETDSERLVTGGDSVLRSAQWHLLKNTLAGRNTPDWTLDNYKERLYALYVINEGLDVISQHCYGVGYENEAGRYVNESGKTVFLTFEQIMKEVDTLGKPFYNGETGGTIGGTTTDIKNPAIATAQKKYINTIIDAGVQLTHWWSFHSDRQGFGDDTTWSVTLTEHKHTFDMIVDANKRLKEKYVVNSAQSANLVEVYEEKKEISTPEPTKAPTAEPTKEPTATPTKAPTATIAPTATPTVAPTEEPTAEPTIEITKEPTAEPTSAATPETTADPTAVPSEETTIEPTAESTSSPEETAKANPTEAPNKTKGCNGTISTGIIFTIIVLCTTIIILKKREKI